MKRTLALLLALIMMLSVVFVACNSEQTPTDTPTEAPTDAPTEKPTDKPTDKVEDPEPTTPTGPVEPDAPIKVKSWVYNGVKYDTREAYEAAVRANFTSVEGGKKSYVSASTMETIKSKYNANAKTNDYHLPLAPFYWTGDLGLQNTKLISITVPINKTKVAVDGNYTFTLTVVDKDDATKQTPYRIAIPAAANGLTDNANVYKFIKLDLTSYNIQLGANDTLGMSDKNDTVLLAYLTPNSTIYNDLAADENMKKLKGFRHSSGADGTNALPCDFEYEPAATSVDEYLADENRNVIETLTFPNIDEKTSAVQKAYDGLSLSVFGDSISTYYEISHGEGSANYNSTLANSALWYNAGNANAAGFKDHKDTYWGRFLAKCNMELCVDNAWSGGSFGGSGNTYDRAQQLHNDKYNVNPDVILTYFGINNTWGAQGRETGDLMALLDERGDKTKTEVIDEWMKSFSGNTYTGTGAPDTFDKCYAYLLYTMTKKYPDAKIVVMSLAVNSHSSYPSCTFRVPEYNEVIKELCEYFGCVYVDQTAIMDASNSSAYTLDGIHPNSEGHRLMFEAAINAIYADLQNSKNKQ